MTYHSEEQLKEMHEDIITFWKWFKQQPIPDNVANDETLKLWKQIHDSGNALYNSTGRPFLKHLLIAGISQLEEQSMKKEGK